MCLAASLYVFIDYNKKCTNYKCSAWGKTKVTLCQMYINLSLTSKKNFFMGILLFIIGKWKNWGWRTYKMHFRLPWGKPTWMKTAKALLDLSSQSLIMLSHQFVSFHLWKLILLNYYRVFRRNSTTHGNLAMVPNKFMESLI